LQTNGVDSCLLRELSHHASHVDSVDAFGIGFEGFQEFDLLVVGVKTVKEGSDGWLISVDAVLD
jgi:hypothetical protein